MISYTSRYNWSLNDYPDKPVGQLGWGFLIYMLAKYGDEVKSIQFYVEKYSVAFPYFINFFKTGYSTPVEVFRNCYELRTFEQFLLWAGLVSFEKRDNQYKMNLTECRATDLLHKIFIFEE